MNTTDTIPEVNMSNTKKELLEVYHALKKQLQAKNKALLDAEKTRDQMELKVAQSEADSQSAGDPLQRLHGLRTLMSSELLELAEKFESELTTFKRVKTAVEARQQELETVYGIETAASDLAALIEAQQEKKRLFAEEMAAKQADFEKERAATRQQWQAEQEKHAQDIAEEAAALKKRRQREKEEFEYTFSREKEQLHNKLQDELQTLEKEIARKKRDFDEEFQQRSSQLDLREKAVLEKENELVRLREQVESFPKELEERIHAESTRVSKQLQSDFEKREALLAAQHEGEKNVLLSRLESMQNMISSYQDQNKELARRQEQAYEKVQDIATRAVATVRQERTMFVPAESGNREEKKE